MKNKYQKRTQKSSAEKKEWKVYVRKQEQGEKTKSYFCNLEKRKPFHFQFQSQVQAMLHISLYAIASWVQHVHDFIDHRRHARDSQR